jgi:hypothetical protein
MVLKKHELSTAYWCEETDQWVLCMKKEYQWIDEHYSEQSPWMNLDDVLAWIIRRDQEKKLGISGLPGKKLENHRSP